MLLSELIAQAQKLITDYGDAEVKTSEYYPQWDKDFTVDAVGVTPYFSYLRDEDGNLVKDPSSNDKLKRVVEGIRYYKV